MNKDPNNPFNWRMRTTPSIFATDLAFTPRKSGLSIGEVQSVAISRKVANGESPGSIGNLGKYTKEKEQLMLAYKQFGVYSKAGAPKKRNKHEQ